MSGRLKKFWLNFNNWKHSKATLGILAVISVVIVLSGGSLLFRKAMHSFQSPELHILKSLDIRSLTVYRLTLDVLTLTKQTKDGNIIVKIASAGLLGEDETVEVLYRACLEIDYGIDIPELTNEYYIFGPDTIKITLPMPRIIGSPQFIEKDFCSTEVVGERSNYPWYSWRSYSDPEMGAIIKKTRLQMKEKIPEWVNQFNLNEKAQYRTEQVIRGLFESISSGKKIFISFDDFVQES